jgi:hypothetical protein
MRLVLSIVALQIRFHDTLSGCTTSTMTTASISLQLIANTPNMSDGRMIENDRHDQSTHTHNTPGKKTLGDASLLS